MGADTQIHHFRLSDGDLSYRQSARESTATTDLSLGERAITVENDALVALFENAGTLSRSDAFYDDHSGFAGDRFSLLATTGTGRDIVVAAGAGHPGLETYLRGSDGSLSPLSARGDTASTYVAQVDMMAAAMVNGQQLVFAASGHESGVSAYRLDSNGGLSHMDSLGAREGIGINAPTALLSTEVGGQPVLVLAAAGSNSISVVGIGSDGNLSLRDHLTDSLSTRFGAVTVMESIIHDGRTYLVAGGGDDGLTLFTLLDDGRLLVLDALADSTALGLDNVNGLALQMQGDTLHVFATSETEAGLTHATATLSHDAVQTGGSGNDTLVAADSGSVLLDGAGDDWLGGGAGADVIVLTADGSPDEIHDFDPNMDRIDLQTWEGLTSVAQLEITSIASGAVLRYGSEELHLHTTQDHSLTLNDFLRRDLLGLFRPQPEVEAPVTLTGDGQLVGGSGEDRLSGRAGDDSLYGQAGDDYLLGADGDDALWGAEGHDTLLGGDGSDVLYGEDGHDSIDGGNGHEQIYGGAGDDSLSRGTGADSLYGGAENDTLASGSSTDQLFGGNGNDSIIGGTGADTLYGGAGNDTIFGRSGWDSLFGGDGNDSIIGSAGDDLLNGGEGNDWISAGSAWDVAFGNNGNDTLYGNFGSDVLSGGAGEDMLYGGTGNDTLLGNQGGDELKGGAGNDLLRGGTLRDTFIFETGHDRDEIEDFRLNEDLLHLSSDLVDGVTEEQAILDTFASIVGGVVVFDFGEGDQITFSNLSSLTGLEDNIFTY
ncbi:MAG: hypothetical protein BM562_04160 [Alphaproteobacteria bacterium MedPE-SWcel]|nr:MAG: hypothetical protein BM562_04160 [Alphaproteobacteria bacterium MedPE-SWcel]